MTERTIKLTGAEWREVVFALRCHAAERRNLANTCVGIESLAENKASFQAEAEQADELATKINQQI